MGAAVARRRDELEAEFAAALQAEAYYRAELRLSEFVRQAWDILEPGREYLHNWHIDLICEYLEAVHRAECRQLIINIPPRWMKSTITTVCFPVWKWIHEARSRIISSSYSSTLSINHSVARRTLIESTWFQRGWGKRFRLASDQNVKSDFMNDHRGSMFATSVGGTVTGRGGDILITDDPHDPRRAKSDVEREHAIFWFDKVFSSRLDDKERGAKIVVMQRLHEKDLTGHLLAQGGWELCKVEAEATSKHTVVFPSSGRTVEREEGDLGWSERENRESIEKAKVALGSDFHAQMNQNPVTAKGGFFPRSWWGIYTQLPVQPELRLMVVDCAEKPGISNDYTVVAIMHKVRNGLYWKRVIRERWGFPDLKRNVIDIAEVEKPDVLIIEDKSAGVQLIQVLEAETTLPVFAFNPGRDDKEIRAAAAQPSVRAGNCYLPERADWREDFLSEHEKFPNSEFKDQVDTTSMGIAYLREEGGGITPDPEVRIL